MQLYQNGNQNKIDFPGKMRKRIGLQHTTKIRLENKPYFLIFLTRFYSAFLEAAIPLIAAPANATAPNITPKRNAPFAACLPTC